VYRLVHKHHHRQHAPSRGNTDAINVHPFEFVVGEYVHLLSLYLTGRALGSLHGAAALVFIVLGGVAASLNHTRLDVRLGGGAVYDVRAHDVHHRLPKSNYGQYTMVWDRLMGTYRAYSDAAQGPGTTPVKKAE
jgi:sterol desaturase/sphingolipid hydroxylase (fatty acid hydroxylase superfamily)